MERTGPAGAPPPATGRPDEVVSDPLVAAAMCLKNVLILVESTLRADTDGAARSPSSKPASEQMAGETQSDGLMGLKGTLGSRSHLWSWNETIETYIRKLDCVILTCFF